MRKSLIIIVLVLFTSVGLRAQESLAPSVVASGGGYFEAENISISWTLGELAVTTLSGGDMILTQGFQQPFGSTVGISERESSWDISAYPNPMGEELRIRFNIEKHGDYLVEVQDVTGRLITQQLYREVNPGDIILLNTSAYSSGVYFLKVLTPDRQPVQVTSLSKL
ncbi:MAG: T9SS type A sorting domain-containing protein [Bacteroidetes bacterium]|nr:T9SS type A sorting domain-containing protein [Bacteroidota bacterium]